MSFNQVLTLILTAIMWGFMAVLVMTFSWNTGWNLAGDAYALGPYLPWLEVLFPLAGFGVWGVFFSQWALGYLRPMHLSRWFYLLLFNALFTLNALLSTDPLFGLGWLTLWLTGSLLLSCRFEVFFKSRYFWWIYWIGLGVSLLFWYMVPGFINLNVWFFSLLLPLLHGWFMSPNIYKRTLLTGLVLLCGYTLPLHYGALLLAVLALAVLWGSEGKNYRRKYRFLWALVLLALIAFAFFYLWPNLDFTLFEWKNEAFSRSFNFWHGAGFGQLEQALQAAQPVFSVPESLSLWALHRWYFELGSLLFLWLPCLWLLSVGHGQNIGFRSFLFWGVVFLYPALWMTPAGVMLGCFWFFNRHSWQVPK